MSWWAEQEQARAERVLPGRRTKGVVLWSVHAVLLLLVQRMG